MFKWLRQRREARQREAVDANRLTKPSNQGEPLSAPDPIEELMRVVGEFDASNGRSSTSRPPVTSSMPCRAVASAATVGARRSKETRLKSAKVKLYAD